MAKQSLELAPKIHLPLDIITLTAVVLAKRGAGKTYLAKRLAELMLKHGGQIVVLDLTGVWWGLRSSEDGKSEGYPITILGGEHADVPLQAQAGEVTAHAIVEGGFSAILDLSLFSKSDAHRFAASFLETLYKINRHALHVFVDEADFYAPQRLFGSNDRAAFTLGAIDTVVRRGRARGLGVTMITQRPQVLNKDVMTQADVLFALRMNHNLEIKAVREWVETKADPKLATEMFESLPGLPTGDAWVWAPELNLLFRDRVSRAETFDSSATPKQGERRRAPKVLAAIDIAKLGERITAVVEEQQANDPTRLRDQIKRLEKQLATPVEPKMDDALLARVRAQYSEVVGSLLAKIDAALKVARQLDGLAESLRAQTTALRDELQSAIKFYDAQPSILLDGKTGRTLRGTPNPDVSRPPERSAAPQRAIPARKASGGHLPAAGDDLPALSKGVARIVAALAQESPLLRTPLAARAGYANSGGFRNLIADAKTAGVLLGAAEGPFTLTHLGEQYAKSVEALPLGRELVEFWCAKVGKGESAILRALATNSRDGIDRQLLADATGYANSGGFRNLIGALRSLGLLAAGGDPVKLREEVWEAMQ